MPYPAYPKGRKSSHPLLEQKNIKGVLVQSMDSLAGVPTAPGHYTRRYWNPRDASSIPCCSYRSSPFLYLGPWLACELDLAWPPQPPTVLAPPVEWVNAERTPGAVGSLPLGGFTHDNPWSILQTFGTSKQSWSNSPAVGDWPMEKTKPSPSFSAQNQAVLRHPATCSRSWTISDLFAARILRVSMFFLPAPSKGSPMKASTLHYWWISIGHPKVQVLEDSLMFEHLRCPPRRWSLHQLTFQILPVTTLQRWREKKKCPKNPSPGCQAGVGPSPPTVKHAGGQRSRFPNPMCCTLSGIARSPILSGEIHRGGRGWHGSESDEHFPSATHVIKCLQGVQFLSSWASPFGLAAASVLRWGGVGASLSLASDPGGRRSRSVYNLYSFPDSPSTIHPIHIHTLHMNIICLHLPPTPPQYRHIWHTWSFWEIEHILRYHRYKPYSRTSSVYTGHSEHIPSPSSPSRDVHACPCTEILSPHHSAVTKKLWHRFGMKN